MKHAYRALAVLAFLALAGCGGGPSNPPPIVATETSTSVPTPATIVATEISTSVPTPAPQVTAGPAVAITAAEAYSKFQQGAFFLDVRSQSEWDQVHIAGSVLIPLEQLQTRIAEVPGSKDVVVVCYGGVLSRRGVGVLQQAGFTQVSYVRGGLDAWMQGGYPIERAP